MWPDGGVGIKKSHLMFKSVPTLCFNRKDKNTALFLSQTQKPDQLWKHAAADKKQCTDILSPKFIIPPHTTTYCKSPAVNAFSNYYLGWMNRPMNPFTFVALTISLIPFGLFIPCFPLQKASASLRHTHMHEPTLQHALVFVWILWIPLQLSIFTQSFPCAFHECFVAATSNSVQLSFCRYIGSLIQ